MLKICRNTFNIRLNLHLHKEVLHINRWGTVSTSCRWRLGTVMGCGGTIPTTGVSTSFLHFRFLVLFRVLLVFTLTNGLYQSSLQLTFHSIVFWILHVQREPFVLSTPRSPETSMPGMKLGWLYLTVFNVTALSLLSILTEENVNRLRQLHHKQRLPIQD